MTLTAISHDVDAQRREAVAVLIMRLTLGIFLLLWSVGKIVTPGATVRIASRGPVTTCSLPVSRCLECSSRFICFSMPIRLMNGSAFDASSSPIL